MEEYEKFEKALQTMLNFKYDFIAQELKKSSHPDVDLKLNNEKQIWQTLEDGIQVFLDKSKAAQIQFHEFKSRCEQMLTKMDRVSAANLLEAKNQEDVVVMIKENTMLEAIKAFLLISLFLFTVQA